MGLTLNGYFKRSPGKSKGTAGPLDSGPHPNAQILGVSTAIIL